MRLRKARLLGLARPLLQPVIPTAPTCSRWFSCSCCHAARAASAHSSGTGPSSDRPQFFSHNPHIPRSTPVPPITPLSSETGSTSAQRNRSLPLPPKLPYSPTSHPFKRHLEALSLSFYSSEAEDSWNVYRALHPDLRRCIPDDIFRSLMRHQLTDTRIKQRWTRLRSLMGVWQKCGLDLECLGRDILESTLDTGLGYYLGTSGGKGKLREAAGLLNTLMEATLAVSRGTKVHVMIRRSWLTSVSAVLQESKGARCMSAREAISSLVQNDMVDGLGKEISTLLRTARPASAELLEQAIKSSNKGIDIKDTTLLGLMTSLLETFNQNPDPAITEHRIEAMIRVTGVGAVTPRYLYLWRRAVSQTEAVSDTADRLLQALATPSGMNDRAPLADGETAMRILQGAHILADLRAVVQYCQKLSRIGAKWHELYDTLATAVYRRVKEMQGCASDIETEGAAHKGLVMSLDDDRQCIDEFLNLLPPADIRPYTQHRVLELALLAPTSSGYNAARRLYAAVRSERFVWTPDRYGSWRSLFNLAVDRAHTQFASRLYTDALADRLVPGRAECLRLIRFSCEAHNASRPILIERLVRDYVAFHAREADREMLINALAEGLSQGKSDDAVLGWTIIKRLMVDHQCSPAMLERVALLLMRCLAKVPLQRQRNAMFDILSTIEDNAQLYEIAITGLARIGNDNADLDPDAALSICTDLYQQLVARKLVPTSKTLSAILIALIKARRVDTAIAVFEYAISHGPVRSDAVGRLMVACALNDRLGVADELERKWRHNLSADAYDRGVVGARVLVDTLKGKKVDLELVKARTGWKPYAHFLPFLETQKTQMAGQAQAAGTTAEGVRSLDAEAIFQSSNGRQREEAAEVEEGYSRGERIVHYA